MLRHGRGALRRLSSSSEWKHQRDRDIYANRAIKEGLRSRAAYKLKEMNERFGRFLRQGAYVVDLGAAPGGFSKVTAGLIHVDSDIDRWLAAEHWRRDSRRMETTRTLGGMQVRRKNGKLICVDVQDMVPVAGATFVRGDINQLDTRERILFGLEGREADVVLSDMAPATVADKGTNHVRIMQLADEALRLAMGVLRNGGTFCCKIFSGSEEIEFRSQLQSSFVKVKAFKPQASKKGSTEVYYVASGYVPDHLRASESDSQVDLMAGLDVMKTNDMIP